MLGSNLYRNIFSTQEVREIWSDRSTISFWLQIEQTLALLQAEMNLIPSDAAKVLNDVTLENINFNVLADEMLLVGRPIVGFVRQLKTCVGPDYSQYIHYGTTTQDIMDTTTVLQMRDGLKCILRTLQKIIKAIKLLAKQHAETRMIGRTNGQWAKPITFGNKAALWAAELQRRVDAINDASTRGLRVQFGGPVGTLDTFKGSVGFELRKQLAERLGLKSGENTWQNTRDGIGDIILSLGQLGTSIEKIAHNVNLLSSSEISELYEAPAKGKGASSVMAHKRNQRCSEFGEALGRLTRGRAMQIGETAIQEHERSGGVWIAEWVIIPEVFLLTSGMLQWMKRLFTTLEVDTTRMYENLESAKKQIDQRIQKSNKK